VSAFNIDLNPFLAERKLVELLAKTEKEIKTLRSTDQKFVTLFTCQFKIKHKIADVKFILHEQNAAAEIAKDLLSIDPSDSLAFFKYFAAMKGLKKPTEICGEASAMVSHVSHKTMNDRLLIEAVNSFAGCMRKPDCTIFESGKASAQEHACKVLRDTGDLSLIANVIPESAAAIHSLQKIKN
jgi:hypothetical protein